MYKKGNETKGEKKWYFEDPPTFFPVNVLVIQSVYIAMGLEELGATEILCAQNLAGLH